MLDQILYLRDKDIVENIKQLGSEENILFIGSEHKLESLPRSGLEWYRINITQEDNAFLFTGNIPNRFHLEIDRFLMEYSKTRMISTGIKYL